MKRKQTLRRGDTMYAWLETACSLELKRSNGVGGGIADSPNTSTAAAASISCRLLRLVNTYTGTSTRSTMDRFRTAGTSTTGTTILTTTTRRTLRRSRHLLTQSTTARATRRSSGSAPVAVICSSVPDVGQNGAALGARNRLAETLGWSSRDPAKGRSRRCANAKNVGRPTRRKSLGDGSAHLLAKDVGTAAINEANYV